MMSVLWRLLKIQWIRMELKFFNVISRRLEEVNRKENLCAATISEENE